MSQHIITLPCKSFGGLVRIQIGWDKPMSEFYLVVFVEPPVGKALDDSKIVYSSLDDRKADGLQDLGYFKNVAVMLGCDVPDVLWRAAYQDQEFNAVNKITYYTSNGEAVEPSA